MSFTVLHDYARDLLGKLATSGWRPVFGWGGGFMLLNALHFAYIEAPRVGVALGDGYYMGLNTALGLFLGAFVARGVEKHLERQNAPARTDGPLVNNEALR